MENVPFIIFFRFKKQQQVGWVTFDTNPCFPKEYVVWTEVAIDTNGLVSSAETNFNQDVCRQEN